MCGWHITMKRNPVSQTELEWENSIVSLRNEKRTLKKRNGWRWFFFSPPCPIVGHLYESNECLSRLILFSLSAWSNPGFPCCLGHRFLPILLSTALQVASTTSPHCCKHNTFWPEPSLFRPWLWTTLNEFNTKSTEDYNDIHNLVDVPP